MKFFIYTVFFCFLCTLSSCGNKKSEVPFNGTFVTATGVKFELKEDSTTFIQFDDSVNYEGVWSIHIANDSTKYANIEFAGRPDYYYVKNGKLYHSEREMRDDKNGATIEYMK